MKAALAINDIAMAEPPFVEALIRFEEYLIEKVKQHRQISDQVELCSQIIDLNQTQSRLLFVFFSKFDQRISSSLQNEVHALYQSLRNIYKDLISVFFENANAAIAAFIKSVKLSSRDILKLKTAIINLET